MKKNKLINAIFYLVCIGILAMALFIDNSAVLLTLGVLGIICLHQLFDNILEAFKKDTPIQQTVPVPVPNKLPPMAIPKPAPVAPPTPPPQYPPLYPPLQPQAVQEQQPITEQQAVIASDFDPNKLMCRYCQKEFKTEKTLRKHIVTAHMDELEI